MSLYLHLRKTPFLYTTSRRAMATHALDRRGVICETRALPGAAIPAEAGIHYTSHWKCTADGLDSRLRGNDRCFKSDPIANNTTTRSTGVPEAKVKADIALQDFPVSLREAGSLPLLCRAPRFTKIKIPLDSLK
jgi:hypothetical protein